LAGTLAAAAQTVLAAAAGPPPPSFPGVLLDWHADPVVVLSLLAAALLYVAGLRRLAAAGRDWPRRRTVAFLSGLATIAVALQSAAATYEDALFSVHVAQHMVLTMLAPPLLALGAPITLALMTTPRKLRQRITRLVHSAPVKALSHPMLAWVIFTLSLYVLYYSPLFGLSLRNVLVHNLVHLHFILAGLLFWWPIIGLDPTRWRLHPGARLGLLFLMLPFHAFLGVALMGSSALLDPRMAVLAPAWADPLAQQQAGGGILWGAGDLIAVIAALAIMVMWASDDEKQARREDRRLDRERAAATGPLRPARPGQQHRR
jgi:cytochrome c oxidase assembly factor CtaG